MADNDLLSTTMRMRVWPRSIGACPMVLSDWDAANWTERPCQLKGNRYLGWSRGSRTVLEEVFVAYIKRCDSLCQWYVESRPCVGYSTRVSRSLTRELYLNSLRRDQLTAWPMRC